MVPGKNTPKLFPNLKGRLIFATKASPPISQIYWGGLTQIPLLSSQGGFGKTGAFYEGGNFWGPKVLAPLGQRFGDFGVTRALFTTTEGFYRRLRFQGAPNFLKKGWSPGADKPFLYCCPHHGVY